MSRSIHSGLQPAILGRRTFVALLSMALAAPAKTLFARAAEAVTGAAPTAGRYPGEVAGIRLPSTPTGSAAYELCRSAAPPFLLNHCLRTYVFGALHAAHHRQAFDAEPAFVASLLHDLGLLSRFASKSGCFEIDGADRAARLVREEGGPAAEAGTVWNAIVMHDMRFTIASHQSPEATLVAAGAGADVLGPDPRMIDPTAVREVVAAFPRLQFKNRFIALLTDHCRRKPGAQTATWLEGFCRQHSSVPESGTERAIRGAPFAE